MKVTKIEPLILYTLLFLGSIPILIPFLWMISSSLKTKDHVGDNPPVIVPINDHAYITRGGSQEEVVLLVERANDRDKVRTQTGQFLEVNHADIHKTRAVELQ